MKHCLSVAGIPLTPPVKTILTTKRERKITFGPTPIWKAFIVRIFTFVSYWNTQELEGKVV